MNDDDLLKGFEDGTLPAEKFHHQEHVKITWMYLQRYCVLEALTRFSANLKKFAAAQGKPDLYHETLTWAYVFLIYERMQDGACDREWDEFAAANKDLLDWNARILDKHYSNERLCSALARRAFVLPDKSVVD